MSPETAAEFEFLTAWCRTEYLRLLRDYQFTHREARAWMRRKCKAE